jgi:hypothetical protein
MSAADLDALGDITNDIELLNGRHPRRVVGAPNCDRSRGRDMRARRAGDHREICDENRRLIAIRKHGRLRGVPVRFGQ